MERINQAYEALNAQARRVTMEYRRTTRAPGKPDVYLSGTAVALQRDRKIRFEQAEGAYRTTVRAKGEAEAGRQGGDLLWINDGRLLWWRYQEPGVGPGSRLRRARGLRRFQPDAQGVWPQVDPADDGGRVA